MINIFLNFSGFNLCWSRCMFGKSNCTVLHFNTTTQQCQLGRYSSSDNPLSVPFKDGKQIWTSSNYRDNYSKENVKLHFCSD